MKKQSASPVKIVILGGGFAGLYTARNLSLPNAEITLIDKKNFHLFQPLLYQVATGAVSPGDIAVPIRHILRKKKNIRVLQAEVTAIDPEEKRIYMGEINLGFDILILAAGMRTYFYRHDWQRYALGLKTLEDAVLIRNRLLSAFEKAETTSVARERKRLLSFVVVGAGPTGVELAGAIGELARHTLTGEYKTFSPLESRIVLIEAASRILPDMPPRLSRYTRKQLEKRGVEVMTGTKVTTLGPHLVEVEQGERSISVPAATIIWAAGIRGVELADSLGESLQVETDNWGRMTVTEHLSIPGREDIYVIGDLASFRRKGKLIPAVAPAAIQQGRYLAKQLKRRIRSKTTRKFKYFDKGQLAVIGRGQAVAGTARLSVHGFPAWLIWAFIHIVFLMGFNNKMLVLFQWAWSYITKKRASRIIYDKIDLP